MSGALAWWKLSGGGRPRGRRVATLHYERFVWRSPRCRFVYRHGARRYVKEIDLGALPGAALDRLDPGRRDLLLAHLGLAHAPSLFRLDDIDRVVVDAFALPASAAAFFADTFRLGAAELRWRNHLDPAAPIAVESSARAPRLVPPAAPLELDERAILFCGGGKDSPVAADLLAGAGVPYTWLLHNPAGPMRRVVEASGNPGAVAIRLRNRGLDPRPRARLRGHRPFNQYLAFLGLLVAATLRARYVVTANERSADAPTLPLDATDGVHVNHQYTKSWHFERRFAAYARELLPGVAYFSALRPLHELAIARRFAALPAYHPHIVSCNRGLYQRRWCCRCSKCAFVLLILHAFLDPPAIRALFATDPLREPRLRHFLRRLVRDPARPWECVGTRDESRVALALALRRGLDPSLFTAADRAAAEAALADHPGLLEADPTAPNGWPHPLRDRLWAALDGGVAEVIGP